MAHQRSPPPTRMDPTPGPPPTAPEPTHENRLRPMENTTAPPEPTHEPTMEGANHGLIAALAGTTAIIHFGVMVLPQRPVSSCPVAVRRGLVWPAAPPGDPDRLGERLDGPGVRATP